MSKIIYAALLLLILSGPANAWTDDDVLLYMNISRDAGDWQATAEIYKIIYHNHQVPYNDYKAIVDTANQFIRVYNLALEKKFNESVCIKMKMSELAI